MEAVYGVAQEYFELVIKWGILLCEVIGFLMIILTAVRGVIAWIRKDPHARLIAAEGIAIALTFKMGGEVLRTVTIRDDWKELGILGAIVLLRTIMSFIIHFEIRSERQLLGDDKTKPGEEPNETPDEQPRKNKKKPKIINL